MKEAKVSESFTVEVEAGDWLRVESTIAKAYYDFIDKYHNSEHHPSISLPDVQNNAVAQLDALKPGWVKARIVVDASGAKYTILK